MPLPPPLSSEARAEALAKAAASRRSRAELKEKLKMGSITFDELLEQADRDDVIGRTKVLTVLESLPGLGKVKARRLMEQLNISLARRIQGLGTKQREALIKEFGQR